MKKLLRIVIPVYNTKLELLERCLESLSRFMNDGISITIYDDCSTKYDVRYQVEKLISNNEKLKYFHNHGNTIIRLDENMGLGFIRNKAIKDAYDEGVKWIVFLDSDDELDLGVIDFNTLKDSTNQWIISYNINLITKDSVITESCQKYLSQMMIPYFTTSNIYLVEYLYSNGIYYDESRRVFEDIMFSMKLWSTLLGSEKYDGDQLLVVDSVLYKYHLDHDDSLTRNEKYDELISDLEYWIEWIRSYYHLLKFDNPILHSLIKSFIFNRIRYEAVKILDMKMKVNGDKYKYSDTLNLLKPYNIDKILN